MIHCVSLKVILDPSSQGLKCGVLHFIELSTKKKKKKFNTQSEMTISSASFFLLSHSPLHIFM